jgi:hypothetical protein
VLETGAPRRVLLTFHWWYHAYTDTRTALNFPVFPRNLDHD